VSTTTRFTTKWTRSVFCVCITVLTAIYMPCTGLKRWGSGWGSIPGGAALSKIGLCDSCDIHTSNWVLAALSFNWKKVLTTDGSLCIYIIIIVVQSQGHRQVTVSIGREEKLDFLRTSPKKSRIINYGAIA
jgi:hypothetical protein